MNKKGQLGTFIVMILCTIFVVTMIIMADMDTREDNFCISKGHLQKTSSITESCGVMCAITMEVTCDYEHTYNVTKESICTARNENNVCLENKELLVEK